MRRCITHFLILATLAVSATWYGTQKWVENKLKQLPPRAGFIRELTQEEKAKVHLYGLILERGMAYRDFAILREVIRCESNWQHYRADGQAVVSSGNIGYGQINRPAWYGFFKANGLDVYEWRDNLEATVWLYENYGLKPWRQWSGHCWEKRIRAL